MTWTSSCPFKRSSSDPPVTAARSSREISRVASRSGAGTTAGLRVHGSWVVVMGLLDRDPRQARCRTFGLSRRALATGAGRDPSTAGGAAGGGLPAAASLLDQLALGAVPAPDRALAGEPDAAAPVVDAALVDAVDRAGERLAAARSDGDAERCERCRAGGAVGGAVDEAAAAEDVEGPEQDQVGDRVARIDRVDGADQRTGGGLAARDGGQDLALGARQAAGGIGQLLELALEGTGEEGQGLDPLGEERQGARIGGGDGDPAGDRLVDRVARQRGAARPQLGELLGLELAQAEEVGDLGVAVDRDQGELGGQAAAGEAGEQADQGELVEQVVLEPQDQLLGARGLVDAVIVGGEPAAGVAPARGPELVAQLPVLRIGDREQRALIEGIGPHADLTGEIGERERIGGAFAVADVDDRLHAPGVAARAACSQAPGTVWASFAGPPGVGPALGARRSLRVRVDPLGREVELRLRGR